MPSSTLIDLASGTIGGIAQVAVGHPLDTIKTALQLPTATATVPLTPTPTAGAAAASAAAAPPPAPTSIVGVARQIIATRGLRGLYAGASSPLAGAMFHNANVFFSYGAAKRAVTRYYGLEASPHPLPLSGVALAGSLASVPISVVETPVDGLKIRTQSGEYSSPLAAAKGSWAEGGARSLFQGYPAVQLRNVFSFAFYFAGFEAAHRRLGDSHVALFTSGAAAGAACWIPAYPLETVKTRMQFDAVDPANRRYGSTVACFRATFQEGGLRVFYRGFNAAVLRAVPVNGAIFVAVSAVKKRLKGEGV
jgi:solute carrier family 25 carnitine/acylcarnitine transporter 20/29